jgi:hypothetical protein
LQNNNREHTLLAFFVAVCIIKMRLVAAFDVRQKRGILETNELSGGTEQQHKQVQELLDQIHANNNSF